MIVLSRSLRKSERSGTGERLGGLLPMRVGELIEVRKLTWQDFRGEPNDSQPWSAHTYWNIKYEFDKDGHLRPRIRVELSPKSWVKAHRKSAHLLNHEQGHYLIGCLCALQFVRRLHREACLTETQVSQLFGRTLREFQELEIKYDAETNHRLNFQMQKVWDLYFYNKLIYYAKIYDPKSKRMAALRERP